MLRGKWETHHERDRRKKGFGQPYFAFKKNLNPGVNEFVLEGEFNWDNFTL